MQSESLETWMDATAARLGLPIAPEHRPGVLHYLRLVGALAPLVTEFALDRDDEPANVFAPVEPRS